MNPKLVEMFSLASAVIFFLILGTYQGSVNSQVSPKMLYDFTTCHDLDNWTESSDFTHREPGMSKASFVLQKTQLFQRAVFFSVLNLQPNGAGFTGYLTEDTWDLEEYYALQLVARAQGQNEIYKILLRHKGMNFTQGAYETFFHAPIGVETTITIPFEVFTFYYRGKPVLDAEPLDKSDITNFEIQISGGVYNDWRQNGTSSLEIDYIQAVVE